MWADVVGYSRLMGMNEEGTLAALNTVRRNLVDPTIAQHKGRIVRSMGDGFLVEFNSVVDAVRCAVKMQSEMAHHTQTIRADRRIRFRVAIAMGDVVTDGDLIYGQGVDIASRMESLAEPGGINVSRAVRDQVRDRLPITFEDMGEHEVKNVTCPIRAFRIVLDKPAAAPGSPRRGKAAAPPEKPAVAVLPFQNLGGDAEAEFFLDSVGEDLITELARARWFSVIARNTSFSHKGKTATLSRSPASSQFAMLSKGVRARPGIAFASAASSSKRQQVTTYGPNALTARSRTRSTCRTGSPRVSSARSLPCYAAPRSNAPTTGFLKLGIDASRLYQPGIWRAVETQLICPGGSALRSESEQLLLRGDDLRQNWRPTSGVEPFLRRYFP
jgi:class 3 adenylate cyclase